MAVKYKQGNYVVRNPEKYVGNINKVRYMSSWENVIMNFFDNNPNILKWSSESVIVKYYSPVDQRHRRYMVDFFVEYRNAKGEVIKELLEVKPRKETIPPVSKRGKKKSTYLKEVYTWNVNQAKWTAATKYAKDRGMTFRLIDETHIFK